MTWPEFRLAYETAVVATLPPLDGRYWRLTCDDFERLCEPATLGDVPALLPRFEAALRGEHVDRRSLAIYLATLGRAMDWAGELDAKRAA